MNDVAAAVAIAVGLGMLGFSKHLALLMATVNAQTWIRPKSSLLEIRALVLLVGVGFVAWGLAVLVPSLWPLFWIPVGAAIAVQIGRLAIALIRHVSGRDAMD